MKRSVLDGHLRMSSATLNERANVGEALGAALAATSPVPELRSGANMARPGNVAARYWTRPDIERARLFFDLWAAHIWHGELARCRGIMPKEYLLAELPDSGEPLVTPLLCDSALDLYDATRVKYERPIARQNPEDQTVFAYALVEHALRLKALERFELGVRAGIEDLDAFKRWCAESEARRRMLLLFLYPRFGPYERPGTLEAFTYPAWESEILEGYRGANPGRVTKGAFGRVHRDSIEIVRAFLKVKPGGVN